MASHPRPRHLPALAILTLMASFGCTPPANNPAAPTPSTNDAISVAITSPVAASAAPEPAATELPPGATPAPNSHSNNSGSGNWDFHPGGAIWNDLFPHDSTATVSPLPSYRPAGETDVAARPVTYAEAGAQKNLLVLSNIAALQAYQLSLITGQSSAGSTVSSSDGASAKPFNWYRLADDHVGRRDWETRALAGVPLPSPRFRLQAATPLTVGSEKDFYVLVADSRDNYTDKKITARLTDVGEHCYVWVDRDVLARPADATLMATRSHEIQATFDAAIYPTDTRLFGDEPNPGIDGDPHIYLLISPAVDNYGQGSVLGYFSRRDEFPPDPGGPAVLRHSNAHEMLNISSHIVLTGSVDDYLGTVAHEFQHMINFNQKALLPKLNQDEDVWIDEGMAMYAMEANGYGLKKGGRVLTDHVKAYQESPATFSLVDWNGNPQGIGYGPVYLFMVYLADRFGEDFLHQAVSTPNTGIANLNTLLGARGTSFGEVFEDWCVANLADGAAKSGDPRYHYRSINMQGTTGLTTLSGFSRRSVAAAGSYNLKLRPFSFIPYALPDGTALPALRLAPNTNTSIAPPLALP